jgi:hypothetical protein
MDYNQRPSLTRVARTDDEIRTRVPHPGKVVNLSGHKGVPPFTCHFAPVAATS